MSRLDLILHGCTREHVPEYVTDPARQERIDRLRASLMAEWEGSLLWGGSGNYFQEVYVQRILGLVDVARYATQLLEHPGDESVRAQMRSKIDDYLRDLDTAKASETWERELRERTAAQRAIEATQKADAVALERDSTPRGEA